MIPKDNAERWHRAIEKHAATITLDALLDMAKALDLKLSVKLDASPGLKPLVETTQIGSIAKRRKPD